MNLNRAGKRPLVIASPGHVVFAATMVLLGIMGLVKGAFTPIWSGVPKGMPARTVLAYACALVSLGCGIGLVFQRTAAAASRVLLVAFSLWFLFFRLPLIFRAPADSGMWWACGETSAMVAATWVLYVWFCNGRGLRFARILYGLALIPFGIAHFTFLDRTVGMVPAWLPGHLFWAYFTGVAFIAAGVAVIIGLFARLAATLATIELGLFTLIVWVPVMVGTPTASDWSEFVVSWVLTAASWVVADSYRVNAAEPVRTDPHALPAPAFPNADAAR